MFLILFGAFWGRLQFVFFDVRPFVLGLRPFEAVLLLLLVIVNVMSVNLVATIHIIISTFFNFFLYCLHKDLYKTKKLAFTR